VALEILDFALVFLGEFAGREGPEVAAPTGLRIGLARVQPVIAGLQFADHRNPLVTLVEEEVGDDQHDDRNAKNPSEQVLAHLRTLVMTMLKP
jgi:hypothetical protein